MISILGSPDNRRQKRLRELLRRVDNLSDKSSRMARRYRVWLEECDVKERLLRCTALQEEQEKARIAHAKDEAVFRVYYGEGGINSKLLRFEEFVAEQMDTMDSTDVIYSIVHNSILSMAFYLFKKLEEERERLDRQEVSRVRPEEFMRQISWKDYDGKLNGIIRQLSAIGCGIMNGEDADVLEHRLHGVEEELEQIVPEENRKLLLQVESSLKQAAVHAGSQEYSGLYETLRGYLDDREALSAACWANGSSLEEYKARMHEMADKIRGDILDRWPSVPA